MCGREIGSNCSCKAFIIRDLVFETDEGLDSRLRLGCGLVWWGCFRDGDGQTGKNVRYLACDRV
jgi:hypothetical protein